MALIERRVQTSLEEANVRRLQNATTEVAFLTPTATGLRKSIMDAISPLREFLVRQGIHDYAVQGQGEPHAVRQRAYFVTDGRVTETAVSMYRPVTKHGDPRIWFRGLPEHADPGDLLAIFVRDAELYVVNVSRVDLAGIGSGQGSPAAHRRAERRRKLPPKPSVARDLIEELSRESERDALELLGLIRSIAASGPVAAIGHGDTAVGRTLETLLGIPINSARKPDWRKIEIKSFRAAHLNRKTLFAQVPDWSRSGCKSSAEILARFGYARPGGLRKLYVTVTAIRHNAQGLRLRLDEGLDALLEVSLDPAMARVANWPLPTLRRRLRKKHAETFWVEADSMWVEGTERFQYRRVVYTRAPIVAQLEPLLGSGNVTVDHLIKGDGTRIVEKGPLFKVDDFGYRLLFPEPRAYVL